jgi:hypothetical protein
MEDKDMSHNEEKCMTPESAMKVLKIIGMVLLGIAAVIAFGFVVQLLWNWLMPRLFGVPVITYWEGLGILALSSILFGRLGGGGSSDNKKKDKKSTPIRDEIKREFVKEFEKEYGQKAENGTNAQYEEMYEKWWEDRGRESFEQYSKGAHDDKK